MENLAYRGFSSVTPENTLTAFRRAAEAGCHRLYADLRMSADGRFFCFSDPSLRRLTGTHGWLHRMDSAEVLDRPVRFAGNVFRVERICSLEELLTLARDESLGLMLNLPCGTSPRWRGQVESFAWALRKSLDPWKGLDLLLVAEDRRMLKAIANGAHWLVGASSCRFAEGLALLEDSSVAFLLLDRGLFAPPRRRRSREDFQQGGIDLLAACHDRGRACYIGPVSKRAELERFARLEPSGILTPHTAQLASLGHRRKS